jgi:hypothetical protein
MSEVTEIEIPFIWPDFRCVADSSGSMPDTEKVLATSMLILGVVHGFSEVGVERLRRVLTRTTSASSNDNGMPVSVAVKVRLIVTLYPTCLTTSDVLLSLLELQGKHPALEVRLVTCDLWTDPQSTLACYKTVDTVPIVMFGSSANFEDPSDDSAHLTLVFSAEPLLAAEWQKWFDVKWLKAVRLTDERTGIPSLILPEGTREAARKWREFEHLCLDTGLWRELIEVAVDPDTGEIVATSVNGTPVPTVSSDNKLPQVSPVYRKLSQLIDMGHLVSVDKTTRLAPFEVSVRPKWFGLETQTQIGSVKRQVSYRISALTEDELKQLENRRKKTSELLDLFSFSIADNQRWMPKATEELFRKENDRVNAEAKDILSKLLAGDLKTFLEARRTAVCKDANRMYRDLFPEGELSEAAIDEIMSAIKKRFEAAEQRPFLPQLSFNRVSLPQPHDSAWKSQLGSALHLLLSIVRYPRKACKNGVYFARGMKAKPHEILKAMNLLNDPFVEAFDRNDAKERAESELEEVDAIESSDISAEEKCQQLFKLLGHEIAPNGVNGQGRTQSERSRAHGAGGTQPLFDSEELNNE